MSSLILFLIRRRLGVKKFQSFYFKNQANENDRYYITDKKIMKETRYFIKESNIRLNFLLSNEAKELIVKG